MDTEITDNKKVIGWMLYDADCRFCIALARRLQSLLVRQHLELLPLQTPWIKTRLGLPDSELLTEMRLLRTDGTLFGGADALLEISRYFWWAYPLRQIARLPGIRECLRLSYQWVARHRHCAAGACKIKSP